VYRLKQVVVTTSWDDGHPTDLKLANLLSQFGIKGTFYVAPYNREHPVMGCSELRLLSEDFEIGAHTRTHVSLPFLPEDTQKDEIRGSKVDLENMLGKAVRMFCYPRGKYNRQVVHMVVSAGFIGARTSKEFYLDLGSDLWRMPTTIQAFPHPSCIRIRHAIKTRNWHGLSKLLRIGIGKNWVELACDLFEEVLMNGGVWHLWGHSCDIKELHLWADLRTVLDTVAHREDVNYLTNGEMIEQIQRQGRAS